MLSSAAAISYSDKSMKHLLFVAVLPLFASGCAATLPPDVIASGELPASDTGVRPAAYSGVVSAYTNRNPVDPKPWRQLNDAQAPKGGAS
ncbi:hypothetical protein CN934_24565 [Ensifer sp. MMN_5]|nr:hypothetical protein CN934_24565 [Ensifer sp. MMN_5]PND27706.1 hypothetical protein CN933_06170 [Sinorhizobium sp. M4_45]RVP99943.1 hypothetical protein CN070_16230 [Sinorhizobium meliloti]